jgi:hypothetical protein
MAACDDCLDAYLERATRLEVVPDLPEGQLEGP